MSKYYYENNFFGFIVHSVPPQSVDHTLSTTVLEEFTNLIPQGYKPWQPVSKVVRVVSEPGEALLIFNPDFLLISQCLLFLNCAQCLQNSYPKFFVFFALFIHRVNF